MNVLDLVYQAACTAVLWTCFCRFVRMDETTAAPIRFAFWLLSVASIACMIAPHFKWADPSWPAALLLGAITVLQYTTSKFWARGAPDQFKGETHEAAS